MYIEDRIERLENLKSDVKRLEDKVNKLESDKLFPNRCNSEMTTEDVVKAICKNLNINIYHIDMTPTVES